MEGGLGVLHWFEKIWYAQVQEDRNHFVWVVGAVVCKVIQVSEIRWGDRYTYIQVIKWLQESSEVHPLTIGSSALGSWEFDPRLSEVWY